MRALKSAVTSVAILLSCTLLTAQTSGIMSDFMGEPPQFIYLYDEVEALTGEKEFVEVLTVSSQGHFEFPEFENSSERVVVLESPPWIWRAIVNPQSTDTLILHFPSNGPTKLRGVPARYSYTLNSLDSSTLDVYEGFKSRVDELDYLSAYDRMAQSGAVGGAVSLVDNKYLDSLDAVFHAEFMNVIESELISSSQFYTDLVMALNWKWRRESGEKPEDLMSSWRSQGGMSRGRTLMQRLNSPGWVQSWAEVHYDWFEGATHELNSYVIKGDVDSIAHYLACSEEEAHLAMWWWDLNAPTQMTSGWWARYKNTPIGMLRSNSLANEDLFTSENFLDQRWTTPSNDIVYTEELYGTWTAILVLKYESMASLREWGAFRGISESIGVKRNDIRFLILCIDGSEESWKKVLRNRTSTDEMVRWVGTDARWMNGLDINSVPQVVVVTPGLDIYNFTAPLPSLGLRRYLKLLPR